MKTISIFLLLFISPITASVPQEVIEEIDQRLENLYYIRKQMDCYTDKIDGKIEGYEEILKLLHDHNGDYL